MLEVCLRCRQAFIATHATVTLVSVASGLTTVKVRYSDRVVPDRALLDVAKMMVSFRRVRLALQRLLVSVCAVY